LHSRHREVPAGLECSFLGEPRLIGHDIEQPDRLRPDAARQPRAPDHRHLAVLGDPDLA
jgi:hypothetical protein